MFEAVDVIQLIKGGVYEELNMSVGDALLKRSDVRLFFPPQNRFPNGRVTNNAKGFPWHLHMCTS